MNFQGIGKMHNDLKMSANHRNFTLNVLNVQLLNMPSDQYVRDGGRKDSKASFC